VSASISCPKCRGPLEAHKVTEQTTVDACPQCYGVWYDKGELAVPLKLETLAASGLGCPRCGQQLQVGQSKGGELVLDQCPGCGGVWFDVGEIQTLRRLAGVEQVASGAQEPERPAKPASPAGLSPEKPAGRGSPPPRVVDDEPGRRPQPPEMSEQKNPDAGNNPVVIYDGVRYAHFQTSIPVTTHVLGEFPWLAAAGDKARARDFVAPPLMLSNEVTENESVWSRGEYVSPEEVWAAFGKPGALPPSPRGVAPAQPNPWGEKLPSVRADFLAAAFAVAAVVVAIGLMSDGRQVFAQGFEFANTDPDKSRVTDVFELKGRTSNVEITLDSNVNNSWAYSNMALIEADTDVAYDFGLEVSYYHGVDDGERWSEGRPYNSVVVPSVPPGRYYLRVETEAYSLPLSLRVTVRRDVMLWRIPLLGLLLLLPPLAWCWLRRETFENERWTESDHPRVVESDDDWEDDE
jgi:Zn-finger nucleic acid-binding protein